MTKYTWRWATLCLVLLIPRTGLPCDSLEMLDAWIREPPPVVTVAAGYFTLKNTGSETAVIERIKSACCAEVAMHKVIAIGDQMRMTPMLNLTVLPGKTVSFTTGSAHLMLIAPTTPLRRGQIVELDFICSDGDSLRTSFDVVYSQ